MPISKCPLKTNSERLLFRGFKKSQTPTKYLFITFNINEKNIFSQFNGVSYVHTTQNAACANIEFNTLEAAETTLHKFKSKAFSGKILKMNFSKPILSLKVLAKFKALSDSLSNGLRL